MPKNYPMTNLNFTDISEKHPFNFWKKELKNQNITKVLFKDPKHASKKKTKHAKIKINPNFSKILCRSWKPKDFPKIMCPSWKPKFMKILIYIMVISSLILCTRSSNIEFSNLEKNLLELEGIIIEQSKNESSEEYEVQQIIGQCVKKVIRYCRTLKTSKELENICGISVSVRKNKEKILHAIRNQHAEYLCVHELMITEEAEIPIPDIFKFCNQKFPDATGKNPFVIDNVIQTIQKEYEEFLYVQKFINSEEDTHFPNPMHENYTDAEFATIRVEFWNWEKSGKSGGMMDKLTQYINCWQIYGKFDKKSPEEINFDFGEHTYCTIYSKIITEKYRNYLNKFPDLNEWTQKKRIIKLISGAYLYFCTVISLYFIDYITLGLLLGNYLPSGIYVVDIIYVILTLSWNFINGDDVLKKNNFTAVRLRQPGINTWRLKLFYTNLDVMKLEISWIMALRSYAMSPWFILASSLQLCGTFIQANEGTGEGAYDVIKLFILSFNVIGTIGLWFTLSFTLKSRILDFQIKKWPLVNNLIHMMGAVIFFVAANVSQLIQAIYSIYLFDGITLHFFKNIVTLSMCLYTMYALFRWKFTMLTLFKWKTTHGSKRNQFQWKPAMGFIFNLLLKAIINGK